MSIKFYLRRDPYGDFSNFSRHPIVVDGINYYTTEHYYQAMKFIHDPEHMRKIIEEPKPGISKELAWQKLPRSDWDNVKDDIMMVALRAKMDQHPDIKKLLLSTGKEELIEDSPVDHYWGCGADGSGKNMLGKLLMQLRDEFRTAVS